VSDQLELAVARNFAVARESCEDRLVGSLLDKEHSVVLHSGRFKFVQTGRVDGLLYGIPEALVETQQGFAFGGPQRGPKPRLS
jgi:hypothetical protein